MKNFLFTNAIFITFQQYEETNLEVFDSFEKEIKIMHSVIIRSKFGEGIKRNFLYHAKYISAIEYDVQKILKENPDFDREHIIIGNNIKSIFYDIYPKCKEKESYQEVKNLIDKEKEKYRDLKVDIVNKEGIYIYSKKVSVLKTDFEVLYANIKKIYENKAKIYESQPHHKIIIYI